MPDGKEADSDHHQIDSDSAVNLHDDKEGNGKFDPERKTPKGLPEPGKKLFNVPHVYSPWKFVTAIKLSP